MAFSLALLLFSHATNLLTSAQNPSVRQTVVNFLGMLHSHYSYSKISQITASQIKYFLDNVTPSLVKTLYDQDEGVRLAAGNVLDQQITLSIMIKVLQDKISPVEIRRTAITIIDSRYDLNKASREILVNAKYPFYLLKQALRDTDIGIRVNAALAFERIQQIDSQSAANIFMEGLKSDNPSIRLTAILGLNQMCFSNAIIQRDGKYKPISEVEKKRCLDAKPAIKLLIASLNDEVKPIQYAAAFALTDIDPKEEYSIPILRKILLEEYNYLLREHAKNSLAKIGSQYAYSTLIRSLAIEDKRVRYSRSVERIDFIYPSDSVPSFPKDISLLIDALEDENIRFLASNTLPEPYWKTINLEDLFRVENIFMKLTSIIKDKHTYNQENLVLKNVFKLKNQDIRRSAVYSLGKSGERLVNSESKNNTSNYTKEDFFTLIKIKKSIIETLTEIINDQSDDINVRWMAAVSLQDMKVDVSHFYAQNNFINPDKVQWQFSRSRKGRGKGPGIRFDTYSADIIYDNRAPAGAGLAEIYNTLRKLLNQGSK